MKNYEYINRLYTNSHTKVGVGVYARETFLELLRGTNNKYYCLVQDDDKDMLNTLKSSKIIFVKSKWFRFFSLDSS